MFPTLFNQSRSHIEQLFKIAHRIDTEISQPIKLSPSRYSPIQQQALQKIRKSHDVEITRKSNSPWAVLLLLTPKKTPTKSDIIVWLVCVDYRELNKITKKTRTPITKCI